MLSVTVAFCLNFYVTTCFVVDPLRFNFGLRFQSTTTTMTPMLQQTITTKPNVTISVATTFDNVSQFDGMSALKVLVGMTIASLTVLLLHFIFSLIVAAYRQCRRRANASRNTSSTRHKLC